MITLCAPTDEAGTSFEEQINSFVRNKIPLAEIRDIIGKNVLDLTENEVNYVLDKLRNSNIKVWSISSPIGKRDFNIPIDKFKERVDKAIQITRWFGTHNLRVFSFFDHKNNVEEICRRLQYIVDTAKEFHINVCLENEKDSYAETASKTLELLNKIQGIKYIYDSSNFIQANEPASITLKNCFPYAHFVHFKDGTYVNGDADITPVGKGEADIEKLINLTDNDMVYSLEHHLKFATEDIPYEKIKNTCKYVYNNIVDAFDDACKHAREILYKCEYKEIKLGKFCKLR